MIHKFLIAAASIAIVALSPTAFAQQTGGAAAEAKAMLERAVAALKANKTKAINMFNKGETSSLTEISMSFATASPTARLSPWATLTQSICLERMRGRSWTFRVNRMAGKSLKANTNPKVNLPRSDIRFRRPGPDDTPVPKIAIVTKAGDLGCGVGYYKQ